MTRRGVETVIAWWTLGVLVVYIPVETWVSLPHGLGSPYFLVDAVAMALLLWGALHSLRVRPRPAPDLLCVGAAWTSANGWRATFDRLNELESGGELAYGSTEMWSVGIATGVGILMFAILLVLVALNQRSQAAGS